MEIRVAPFEFVEGDPLPDPPLFKGRGCALTLGAVFSLP